MLLIKNGNVYLGAGRYESGWDVLCEGDTIKDVGANLKAAGADVIDADGRDVYPGLVLALCSVGAVAFAEFPSNDMNEAVTAVVPQMNIRHALDLREIKLQRFGRVGITSYGLSPGTSALIGGQMAFVHVDGERTADVILAEKMAIKGNYTQTVKMTFKDKAGPMTRMSMYQLMDEAFRGAKEYMAKEEKEFDEGKEALGRVLAREIPFIVRAHSYNDIDSVIQLAKKYDLKLVIAGAFGVEGAADAVIEQGYHVILGDSNSMMTGLKNKTCHKALIDLYRKGMKLSIYSSGDDGYPNAYEQLLWVAAQMHAAGALPHEIMDMMTINPARALGVDHLVGSLEVGKKADIVIARGNPAVRFDNYVDHTIVAGKHFFERAVN